MSICSNPVVLSDYLALTDAKVRLLSLLTTKVMASILDYFHPGKPLSLWRGKIVNKKRYKGSPAHPPETAELQMQIKVLAGK